MKLQNGGCTERVITAWEGESIGSLWVLEYVLYLALGTGYISLNIIKIH